MAQKVIKLLRSPDFRQGLEQKGIIYSRQNHSYEKIARRLEATLEEAIKKKHGE